MMPLCKYYTHLRSKWKRAKIAAENGGWFENMFKSIEKFDIFGDGMILLDKLPIELLFDPDESHLNEILFDPACNPAGDKDVKQYINRFGKQYLNIQNKFKDKTCQASWSPWTT